MKIKERLIQVYKENGVIYTLCAPLRELHRIFGYYIISDEVAIRRKFKKKLGYALDLKNPKTFSEKMQWLKLYNREAWFSDCADKFKVREYVSKKLGTSQYLIPLFFETTDWRDVKAENMPNGSFVIKCNHDNSSHTIIHDKTEVDWKKLRAFYRMRLNSMSFFWINREWPYKDVKPRVMVESFLCSKKQNHTLLEYKFYCFNGEIKLIQLSILDKDLKKRYRYLDENYNSLEVDYSLDNHLTMIEDDDMIELRLKDEMKDIAKKLARDFKYHIRVDIYQIDDQLYVGELTFFDSAGFIDIKERDVELGSYLILPTDNVK